mgnify:CR=1 FL=1
MSHGGLPGNPEKDERGVAPEEERQEMRALRIKNNELPTTTSGHRRKRGV